MAISDMLRYVGKDARPVQAAVLASGDVRQAATILQEHLAGMRVVQLFGREQWTADRHAEVNDALPDDIVDPEQIEDIIGMINGMGIEVHEIAPDVETLLLSDAQPSRSDDDTVAAPNDRTGLTPDDFSHEDVLALVFEREGFINALGDAAAVVGTLSLASERAAWAGAGVAALGLLGAAAALRAVVSTDPLTALGSAR